MSNIVLIVAAVLITIIAVLSINWAALLLIGLILGGLLGWNLKPVSETPGLPEGEVAVNEQEVYAMIVEHGLSMFEGAIKAAEKTRQTYNVIPNIKRIQSKKGDFLLVGVYVQGGDTTKHEFIHLFRVQETIEEINRDNHQEKRNRQHSAAEQPHQPARRRESRGAHAGKPVGYRR